MFEALAFLVLIAAAAALMHYLFDSEDKQQAKVDAWRSEAERQFTAIVIESPDPTFAFRGDAADVVEQTEAISRDDSGRMYGYTLKRFARNEAGEYFMFLSNSDGKPPFFKHVPQANARIALKAKYVPPREAAP